MTLIAAIKGQDGLVLASDSRGTIGDPRGLTAINDTHKKIFRLSDYCGIATSGAAELNNRFVDYFIRHLDGKGLVDVEPVVNEFIKWGKNEFRNWFGARPFFSQGQAINDQRPVMVFIIAGYNQSTDRECRIYLLSSSLEFAPQLCTSGHMLAGVPQYATYLLHRLYNPQMSLKHVRNLSAYLIHETATQDPKVGGPVRIAEITTEDGFKELSEDVVSEIVKKNEEQNQKLRQFFFDGGGDKND